MKKLILMTMFLLFVLGCHLVAFRDKNLISMESAEELGIDPKIALQVSDPDDLRKITSTPKTRSDLIKEIEKGIASLGNKANLNYIDVSKVTNFSGLFNGGARGSINGVTIPTGINTNQAKVFDGIINQWDVSKVTNMFAMFAGAASFNGDIEKWDVGNVTNMSGMFDSANAFNQDLSEWDVSNVKNMEKMFISANVFNQNLSAWGTKLFSSVKVTGMFAFSGLSTSNKPSWCSSKGC